MAADTRDLGVGDEVDGIRRARVLRDRGIGVIALARLLVIYHVLEHGAEADRAVDLGLLLGRKIDGLGVAPPFDVEDTVVGPAMLVVSDQTPARVGRQRGLAGAGEAEEERDVAV